MSYRFADSLRAGSGRNQDVLSWSCSQAVSKPVWHIPLLCVKWITPDDGQRNCPKHLEFYSKNKFWEISASSWFYYKHMRFVVSVHPCHHPHPGHSGVHCTNNFILKWLYLYASIKISMLGFTLPAYVVPAKANLREEASFYIACRTGLALLYVISHA